MYVSISPLDYDFQVSLTSCFKEAWRALKHVRKSKHYQDVSQGLIIQFKNYR